MAASRLGVGDPAPRLRAVAGDGAPWAFDPGAGGGPTVFFCMRAVG
jgi:hypothetical protein